MAVTGKTASIAVNDGVANASVAIPNIIELEVPFGEVDSTDFQTLDGDGWVQSIPTVNKLGTFKFSCVYTAATYQRMALIRGVPKAWTFDGPDGDPVGPIQVSGFLTKCEMTENHLNVNELKIEVKGSGGITLLGGDEEE